MPVLSGLTPVLSVQCIWVPGFLFSPEANCAFPLQLIPSRPRPEPGAACWEAYDSRPAWGLLGWVKPIYPGLPATQFPQKGSEGAVLTSVD